MITYTINGVDIRNVASRLETAEGTQTAPATVGDNVVLPGADGALDAYPIGQQRRPDDVARIVFAMSIKGVDPVTGLIGGDGTLQEYLDRADEAIRMFRARSLDIVATRPDGSQRRAFGHLSPGESLDFTRDRSSPAFGRYVASVEIPAGRWEDAGDPVTTGAQTLATGGDLDLSVFAAATAVCTDLDIRISRVSGSPANPRLTTETGYVGWTAAIATGRELRIQTRVPGTVSAGTGDPWTPGYDDLEFSPGPRFFEVDPTAALTGELTFTGGGTMSIEVSGRRHYGTS